MVKFYDIVRTLIYSITYHYNLSTITRHATCQNLFQPIISTLFELLERFHKSSPFDILSWLDIHHCHEEACDDSAGVWFCTSICSQNATRLLQGVGSWVKGLDTPSDFLIHLEWISCFCSGITQQMPERPVSPQDFTGHHSILIDCGPRHHVPHESCHTNAKDVNPVLQTRENNNQSEGQPVLRRQLTHTHTHNWLQPFHHQHRLLIVVHRIERHWTCWRVH